jgi:nucleotide-binding universal stress UspA family protein
MVSTILVPLDGSDLARHALPFASFLAGATGARLVLMHAYQATAQQAEADPELDLVQEHADLASGLRARGVHATTWLSYERPGPAIVRTAADLGVDLIVMSTHGRGGVSQLLFGSVAEHVLQRASTPVVLVTAQSGPRWDETLPMRILVPLDGTRHAEAALEPASDLARTLRADLVLVRAPEPAYDSGAPWQRHGSPGQQRAHGDALRYLEDTARPLRLDGHRVELRVESGPPSDAIARAAGGLGPALVVMATHGRGTLTRLLVESVAAETLRKLTVPVLLVRPGRAGEHSGATGKEGERAANVTRTT